MKKIFLGAAMTLAAANANAGLLLDFYAGATYGGGKSIAFVPTSKDLKNNADAYGAVFGIDIPIIRVEAEYNRLVAKDIALNAGMLNAYLKMPVPVITPYVGFGAGRVFGGDLPNNESASASSAFQGMLGVQLDIPATPLFVDVEGRVFYADSIDTIPVINKDVGFLQYDARIKLRYVF
ncbi:MAG: outer membrane beta-barrel protein [Rickettsiales bacterium]|jgi:opacity protein-like surface antigen|nr:outer membrane beta-barrel protein [Rickettsiales bacterium]